MTGPLAGRRIIDLSQEIAGPFCTKLLAAFGAEVIKVEPPDGDSARYLPPFLGDEPGPERSGLFAYLNTGKRSVVLDLEEPEGRGAILRLVETADVLVESFAPGVLDGWGLAYETLASRRPGLVVTSITNFGQMGPYRDRQATELTLMAASGYLHLVGEPGREPVKLGGSQAQMVGGLNAAGATLAAMLAARMHGTGAHVDISLQECMHDLQCEPPLVAAYLGAVYGRFGCRHRLTHPMTLLPCKDGWVAATATGSGHAWEAVALAMEEPRLLDPRFATGSLRQPVADEVDALMAPWLMARTRQEIMEQLQELRVAFGKVMSARDLADDDHLAAREFFVESEHPVLGRVRFPGLPVRFSETPAAIGRAPLLGEHTAEALAEAPLEPRRHEPAARHPETGPLHGLEILDLTMVWAGPYATSLLADLGADVVKVESIQRIEGVRIGPNLPPPEADFGPPWERGGIFNRLNRNKRGITLNLANPRGRALLLRLLPHFDAVIENYSARVMRNFHLDYEAVRAANPSIVMMSMPGFGLSGPYEHYTALGTTIEPMGGLSWLTGYEGEGPLRANIAYADPIAGLTGVAALLAAVIHARETGQGQFIELSQLEALTCMVPEAHMDYALNGRVLSRMGNRDLRHAPQGVIRAAGADRWVAFTVRSDEEWARLLCEMGCAERQSDARFQNESARQTHHTEALNLVRAWGEGRPEDELVEAFTKAGVPSSPVLTNVDLLHDPHLRDREAWVSIDKPAIGRFDYTRPGWRFTGAAPAEWRAAPELGRDNADVLGHLLQLSADEIAALADARIIGTAPIQNPVM